LNSDSEIEQTNIFVNTAAGMIGNACQNKENGVRKIAGLMILKVV